MPLHVTSRHNLEPRPIFLCSWTPETLLHFALTSTDDQNFWKGLFMLPIVYWFIDYILRKGLIREAPPAHSPSPHHLFTCLRSKTAEQVFCGQGTGWSSQPDGNVPSCCTRVRDLQIVLCIVLYIMPDRTFVRQVI